MVHISDAQIEPLQILRQRFGHFLRQRHDKHSFFLFDALLDLGNEVVDLSVGRSDADKRIEKPRRTYDLLDDLF